MNDGLKQRIIGALVLVALGIIFIPVIFDRERIVPVDRESQIPPQPASNVIILPEPPVAPRSKAPELAQPIDGRFDIEETPVQEGENTSASSEYVSQETSEDKAKDEKVLGPVWVLQVASFETKKRALSVLKELEASDFRGFVREVDTAAGKRTRLFVGPNVDKAKLKQAKTTIDKKLKVESIILRFRP